MIKKLAIIFAVLFSICFIAVLMNPFLLMVPMMASGLYEGMHQKAPLEEAHQRAVKSFVESRGFGIARIQRKGFWNEHTVLFEGTTYQPWTVRLIGLTPEHGYRYFADRSPPRKKSMASAVSRELTSDELSGVKRLLTRTSTLERLPDSEESTRVGAIRVIAPILAQDECLKCHSAKAGDILGAFEYSLIPDN